jgi:hypothetical protein
MSPTVVVPQLALRNVRKIITAGAGVCRVRVTVLHSVSLELLPGEALAVTGKLPLARSMLCAIAAGVARCDAGRVQWGVRGIGGVRYAPAGDAPRALQRRDAAPPGVVILDAALVEHATEPDVCALVRLLTPWLDAGGAALVAAAPVTAREWPWRIVELAGGTLRVIEEGQHRRRVAWPMPHDRMVAEGSGRRVAQGSVDQ